MSVIAKADVTISDILDGNSISEITNFYKVSSKSSGETAPQTSGGRNLIIGSSKYRKDTPIRKSGIKFDDYTDLHDMYMSIEPGETYVFQCCTDGPWGDHITDGTGGGVTHLFLYFMTADDQNGSYAFAKDLNHTLAIGTNTTGRGLWKYTVPTDHEYVKAMFRIDIHSDGNTDYSYNYWDFKAEKGNKATDWTPAPEDVGWSTTVPTLTATNKYLWNYEMITGSDGQVISYTEPRVIGVYGDKGNTGNTGATGNGIKSITEYYQISTSNTTAPTSWVTTVPTLTATNKYLWNYEKITYTNGTSVDTAKRVIGVYGDKGNTGATGPAGKGIKSTAITYQASTSGTTAPTGTWNTSVPSVPQGQYLWSRTVITYTDNSTSTTYSVAYIPKNGQNGATGSTGPTGTGVASIVQQYYLSTSKTSQTGGSWVTSMPTWSSGKYLWTRYQINYKNPTSTSYTTPVCDSSWEAVNEVQVGGRNLVIGASKYRKDTPILFSGKLPDSIKDIPEKDLSMHIEPGETYVFQCCTDGPWGNHVTNGTGNGVTHLYVYLYVEGNTGGQYDNAIDLVHICAIGNNTTGRGLWKIKIPSDKKYNRARFRIDIHSDNVTTFKYKYWDLKAEKGNVATDWTPAPEDVQADIDEAAKTATNYMNFDNNGLVIGDLTKGTLGRNVLIDSDSVDIRNGTNTLATFSDNLIELGKGNTNSAIKLCDGAGTIDIDNSLPGYNLLKLKTKDGLTLQSTIVTITQPSRSSTDPTATISVYGDLPDPESDTTSSNIQLKCKNGEGGSSFIGMYANKTEGVYDQSISLKVWTPNSGYSGIVINGTRVMISNGDLYDKYNKIFPNGVAVYGGGNGPDPNTTLDSLILSAHANAPGSGFKYIYTAFYNNKTTTSNRGQFAVPYGDSSNYVYYRFYYNGSWSAWYQLADQNDLNSAKSLAQRSVNWLGKKHNERLSIEWAQNSSGVWTMYFYIDGTLVRTW